MSQCQELHKNLQQCLIVDKVDKMELANIVHRLMPEGAPDFANIINYPKVSDLAKGNYKATAFVLTSLMRDFCSSFNVVRNMNEDQIIEAALHLIDEADNFRLEDFVIMFSLAKKGKLDVKIMDRIDIDVINRIWDCYYTKRENAKHEIDQKRIEREEGVVFAGRTENVDSENIAPPEAWTKLLNQVKADYSDGKTGYHLSDEEKLKAKQERVSNAAKLFWGEKSSE